MTTETYRLTVNGTEHDVADGWIGESLLYVLRERLGLPGAKNACEQGECGSCSVLVDGVLGAARASCSRRRSTDVEITTVEAMADDGVLSDVQQAFVDAGAVQCGFCTPGLVMAVHDLLARSPDAGRARSARSDLRATSAGAPATAASCRRCATRCSNARPGTRGGTS